MAETVKGFISKLPTFKQAQSEPVSGRGNAVAPTDADFITSEDANTIIYDRGGYSVAMPLTYDPNFYGPSGVLRKFFDGQYMVVMILVLVALGFLGVWSIPTASVSYLYHGADVGDRLCGGGERKNSELLAFGDPFNNTATKYCVEVCPRAGDFLCYAPSGVAIVIPGFNGTRSPDVDSLPGNNPCPGGNFTAAFDGAPVFNRCMPEEKGADLDYWRALEPKVDILSVMVGQLYGDIYTARFLVGGGFFLSIGLSYMLTLLLEGMVKVYTAVAIIIGIGAPAYLGAQVSVLNGLEVDTRLKTLEALLNTAKFAGIVMLGFSLVLMIYLFLKRGRVKLATSLFKETYSALRVIPGLSSVPLMAVASLVPFIGFALTVALSLLALSRQRAEESGSAGGLNSSSVLGWLGLFHVMAMYWLLSYLIGIVRVGTAGAVAEWYWTREPRAHKMREKPLREAFKRSVRFHSGSAAMGSLIIPYLFPFKIISAFLPKDAPSLTHSWYLYMNNDAYVQVAQHGAPLLESARKAAHLLRRNEARVGSARGVTSLLLLQGELATAGLCGVVANMGIDIMGLKGEINNAVAPVLCVIVIALAASAVYFSVYDTAIETILQCFAEDCERNDGTMMRQYYMPESLKAFIIVSAGGEVDSTLRVRGRGGDEEDGGGGEEGEEEGSNVPWWKRRPKLALPGRIKKKGKGNAAGEGEGEGGKEGEGGPRSSQGGGKTPPPPSGEAAAATPEPGKKSRFGGFGQKK